MNKFSILVAFCFVATVIFFFITISLQEVLLADGAAFGLFGATIGSSYSTYNSWDCSGNEFCILLGQFKDAGNTAGAFLIISMLPLLLCAVVSVLRILGINLLSNVLGGKIVTYSALVVTGLFFFSWILWATIRPYSPLFYYGFSYNALLIVISFAILGTVFSFYLDFKEGDKGGYVSLEDGGAEEEIPSVPFSLRNMILFASWQTPIASRILYYLSMIISLALWMSYMVGAPESGLRAEFYRRLLMGLFAAILFIAAIRVFCELAMKAHIKAGTYGSKPASSEKRSYGTVEEQPANSNQSSANYGNEDLFVQSKDQGKQESVGDYSQSNQNSGSYQEIN